MNDTQKPDTTDKIKNQETPEQEAQRLINTLRIAILKKMIRMATQLPAGYYTEIKGQVSRKEGILGTFKLRDYAASLKDLATLGQKPTGGESDIEDWAPIAAKLGLIDDEDDQDED